MFEILQNSFSHRKPSAIYVFYVRSVPPQPTFHRQKGWKAVVLGKQVARENFCEEEGEMEWVLFQSFERPEKWLWILAVSFLKSKRVHDYRVALKCCFPHKYCQNSVDVISNMNISRFCFKLDVVILKWADTVIREGNCQLVSKQSK